MWHCAMKHALAGHAHCDTCLCCLYAVCWITALASTMSLACELIGPPFQADGQAVPVLGIPQHKEY